MTDFKDIDPVAAMHAAASSNDAGFDFMEKIRTMFMKTNRFTRLTKTMDEVLAAAIQREDLTLPPSFTNRARGAGACFVGPTGGGKSKALARYFDRHPILKGYQNPASRSPLLSVAAPSPCTIMQLARTILRASGYPIERDLPAHRLWELAFERLENLQKFILHLDELQHVTHNVSEREQQAMCDILKNAMYGQRLTIIISGVDTLIPFLQFDDQLFRRLTIMPFDAMTPSDLPDVERMVREYAAAANLTVVTTPEEALYARLSHAALRGFGYAVVITLLAIENAMLTASATLSKLNFANAFAKKTGFAADRNPFLASRYFEIDCSAIAEKKLISPPPEPTKRGSKKP
jgi:Bacterial TniB protein